MKNYIKVLSLATLLAISSTSCASNYQGNIDGLRVEVQDLQNTVHKYSENMYEQYVSSVNKVIKQQKELIENLSNKQTKEKLNAELISIEQKLNELNNTAADNKEKIYKIVIARLKHLNESLARAYS